MAYIGKQPVVGNFQVCDAISVVNGQAAYTMQVGSTNVEPENANHMLVSLNGILQKPGSSFTISGATITFASNLATGDVIDFIILLGDTLNIGTPSDSSITSAKLNATAITGQTAETSAADADTIIIHDDSASALRKMTRSNFLSGVGGANTPYFEAYLNSNQSISSATYTKVQFNTETYDTASDYDNSSNYRYTPTTSGKYYVYTRVQCDSQAASNLKSAAVEIRKNGSTYFKNFDSQADNQSQECNLGAHGIITMNGSSDYLEVFGYVQDESGSPRFQATSSYPYTIFGAFKIIE